MQELHKYWNIYFEKLDSTMALNLPKEDIQIIWLMKKESIPESVLIEKKIWIWF